MVTALNVPAEKIPADLYEAMLADRITGEHLLWGGRPDSARVLRTTSYLSWFFAPLAWGAVIFLCSFGATICGPWLVLFCVIVALGGPILAAVPFVLVNRAKRTAYAITNRRLLTAVRQRNGEITVTAYAPRLYETPECVELPDGSGDLFYTHSGNPGGFGYAARPGGSLVGIPHVRQVEQLLRESFSPASPARK